MKNINTETVVLVHYKTVGATDWTHNIHNFDRVPAIGECVTFERDSAWYSVKSVLHIGFPLDYDAELWALEVDPQKLRENLDLL